MNFKRGLILGLSLLQFFLLFDGIQKRTEFIKRQSVIPEKPSSTWWKMQLQDPSTGEVPANIRHKDLAFARNTFPVGSRSDGVEWKNVGPNNIGGRTRALAFDRKNSNIIIAGAASGGIWKSTDQGNSWKLVTTPEHNISISWLHQDPRQGEENNWYACTGEPTGASQGAANFSAHFGGDGVLASNDNGETWNRLGSFINDSPQRNDSLDLTWKILVDNQSTQTILLLASHSGIYRSEDQGASWKNVSGNRFGGQEVDLVQTSDGIWYAAFGGNLGSGGLFRSVDGITFNLIGKPESVLGRGIIGLNPQNENSMYVLYNTDGKGLRSEFLGRASYHSLYKYTYISGNGSGVGGNWENISNMLPHGPWPFDDYYAQGGYCMDIKVSPYDSNLVALAGINLNISEDGFATQSSKFAGGYYHKIDTPLYQIYPNHHPDVQVLVFHPTDSNIMMTGSDGGIHLTRNLYDTAIVWESLNNGYVTTQFYTLAIPDAPGSTEIIGGLQDNGTLYSSDVTGNDWTMPVDYDGAYCHFLNHANQFVAAKQQDGIVKVEVDANGIRTGFERIDPEVPSDYLFINPYTVDPNDDRILYLPNGSNLYRCLDIGQFPINNQFAKKPPNTWDKMTISGLSGTVSAIEASVSPANRVYIGTNSGGLFRIDSANSNYTSKSIKIPSGNGFVSSIAADPANADRVVVVFSNYNIYSVFYSENAGEDWQNVSGNLEGKIQPGVPPQLMQINDGPSCRVAKFVELEEGTWLLVGTSVGLYGALNLDSMNTVWDKIGEASIANNVVTAIEFRKSDGRLAIATHGQGVFSANVESLKAPDPTGVDSEKEFSVTIIPNPVRDFVKIDSDYPEAVRLNVFDFRGKLIPVSYENINGSFEVNLDGIAPGTYFIQVSADNKQVTKKIIKL